MPEPMCGTCKYFHETEDDAPTCRRLPLVTVVFNGAMFASQPYVCYDDVCGEHSPRPDLAPPELPDGWEWHDVEYGTRAFCSSDTRRYATVYTGGNVEVFMAPLGVVEAVAQAHRARAAVPE